MKKNIIIFAILLTASIDSIAQQLKLIPITAGLSIRESAANDTLSVQQGDVDKVIQVKMKLDEGVKKNTIVTFTDLQHNSARLGKEYQYYVLLPNYYNLTSNKNFEDVIAIIINQQPSITTPVYAELDFKYPDITGNKKGLHKILVLEIIGKNKAPEAPTAKKKINGERMKEII